MRETPGGRQQLVCMTVLQARRSAAMHAVKQGLHQLDAKFTNNPSCTHSLKHAAIRVDTDDTPVKAKSDDQDEVSGVKSVSL